VRNYSNNYIIQLTVSIEQFFHSSNGIFLLKKILYIELPWDRPVESECPEYLSWKEGKILGSSPWNKLDLTTLSFVKRLLCPQPSKRITIAGIANHPWMTKKYKCMNQKSNLNLRGLSVAKGKKGWDCAHTEGNSYIH